MVTIVGFCSNTAKPLVVPASDPVPAASPCPNACVPRTSSLLYCTPAVVTLRSAVERSRVAVALPFAVYVQRWYGFEMRFPVDRWSGPGMMFGGRMELSFRDRKSRPATPTVLSHDRGRHVMFADVMKRSLSCLVMTALLTSGPKPR